MTRSPGSSDGMSRAGLALAAASARAAAEEKLRRPAAVGAARLPGPRLPPPVRSGRVHIVWAASVRFQSTRSTGSSLRKREPGLCAGAPHADRINARET